MDISSSIEQFRDNLADGIWNSVTPDEVRNNTLILDGLDPASTNELVSRLSNPELDKWTDEIFDGELMFMGADPLSADDRNHLYSNLAQDLDATQMERFYNALGDESRQAEFIDSIANSTTPQNEHTRVALIERLAADTTSGSARVDGTLTQTSRYWDQDAQAVSTLLSKLPGNNALEQAFGSLNDEQLEAVLNAGIKPESFRIISSQSTYTSYSFDTTGFAGLIDRVANSDNPDLKARVFELGSRQISEIRDTDSLPNPNIQADHDAGEVANALSTLLRSDTVGIITSLERGDGTLSSRAGNGLSTHTAELVRQGEFENLAETIAFLQQGNDLKTDPKDYLSEFTTETAGGPRDYQNASNLGMYVGSVWEGIEAFNADSQEKADILTTIFGSVLSLIPTGNLAVKIPVTLAKPATTEIINSLSNDDIDLAGALEELALPEDVNSSDITNSINSAIEMVIRN